MSINLYSLETTEIVPQKANNTNYSYRINQSAIKENWDETKASSKNLIEESKQNGSYRESVSLEGAGLEGIKAGKGAYCNYSSDAFFRKDMPLITDSEGNYTVGGQIFTKEELEECRTVLKAAADSIGCGIGKNANISYKNYAEMGIAVNAVKEYASQNLTEKQAAVVNKAMQEYNEALVQLENDTLARAGAVQVTGTRASEYYGMGQPISKDVLDHVRSTMGVTDGKLTGGTISATNSATNKELIGKISDAFSNADITDKSSVDDLMEKYKKLVTPAYMAYGNYGGSDLARILGQDVSGFRSQIANMLNAIKYHAVDYRV